MLYIVLIEGEIYNGTYPHKGERYLAYDSTAPPNKHKVFKSKKAAEKVFDNSALSINASSPYALRCELLEVTEAEWEEYINIRQHSQITHFMNWLKALRKENK